LTVLIYKSPQPGQSQNSPSKL